MSETVDYNMKPAHEYAHLAEDELEAAADTRSSDGNSDLHLRRAQVYATLAVAAVGGH